MEPETVETIFVDQLDADKDGKHYKLPKDKEVTVVLEGAPDVISIPEVRQLRVEDGYFTLTTDDEQVYIDGERIFAIRQGDSGLRSDARPGFHS